MYSHDLDNGAHGGHQIEGMGLIFTTALVRYLLNQALWAGLGLYNQHFLDAWLLQTVLLEGIICLWLPTLLHPFPPTHPFIHAICDITIVVKMLLKIQQCQLATRDSYKRQAKRLLQLVIASYCKSSMATIQHKRTIVASILTIGILRNTKCDNLVGFPKLGHIITVQLKGNLTPAHGQWVQHLRVILVLLITGMRMPVGIFPVLSKAWMQRVHAGVLKIHTHAIYYQANCT